MTNDLKDLKDLRLVAVPTQRRRVDLARKVALPGCPELVNEGVPSGSVTLILTCKPLPA